MANETTAEIRAAYEAMEGIQLSASSGDAAPADPFARALYQFKMNAPRYRLFRRYYDGHHRLAFATEKFLNAFGSMFQEVADNLCEPVVDATADRLEITGFEVIKGAAAAAAMRDIWEINRMDVRQSVLHEEALISGDAYLLVWPDSSGRPVLWPQRAALCTVFYDEETPGRLAWGAKMWLAADQRLRLNMYFPDQIQKYISKRKDGTIPDKPADFEQFQPAGEAWPLPNPFDQVPLFHFPNKGFLSFGVSELRSVVPLQDALNKTLCDQLVAQEFLAYPQRWATGVEIKIDPQTGEPAKTFTPGADNLWKTRSTDAKFGQFETADIRQYVEVQESLRKEIARVSGTPLHYFALQGGEWPSGEALRSSESRLVKKVKRLQGGFGNVWEDVMSFALRIGRAPVGDAMLSAQWTPAESFSEGEKLDNLIKKSALKVPHVKLWAEAGYTELEIAEMEAAAEDAADRNALMFNSGRLGGGTDLVQ